MKSIFLVIAVVVVIVGFTIGVCVGVDSGNCVMRRQAIKNGAAYYDPNTGEFTWIVRKPVEIRHVLEENQE